MTPARFTLPLRGLVQEPRSKYRLPNNRRVALVLDPGGITENSPVVALATPGRALNEDPTPKGSQSAYDY